MNHKSVFFYKFGSAAITVASFAIALSTAVPDTSVQSTGLLANGQASELPIWSLHSCP
jgi:hypothetical protein